MSESDPERRLADAHEEYRSTREAIDGIGEGELRRLASVRGELSDLFARYEDRATGTGDFRGFIEFQSQLDELLDDLPAGLRHRETFEEVEELFDKRRLNGGRFRARP